MAAFTHATSVIVCKKGDNITTHIVNLGAAKETVRIRTHAYRVMGGVISDSGDIDVPARSQTATSITLADAQECWVEVEATAETVLPTTYFIHVSPAIEFHAVFKGSDFAVFDSAFKRLW